MSEEQKQGNKAHLQVSTKILQSRNKQLTSNASYHSTSQRNSVLGPQPSSSSPGTHHTPFQDTTVDGVRGKRTASTPTTIATERNHLTTTSKNIGGSSRAAANVITDSRSVHDGSAAAAGSRGLSSQHDRNIEGNANSTPLVLDSQRRSADFTSTSKSATSHPPSSVGGASSLFSSSSSNSGSDRPSVVLYVKDLANCICDENHQETVQEVEQLVISIPFASNKPIRSHFIIGLLHSAIRNDRATSNNERRTKSEFLQRALHHQIGVSNTTERCCSVTANLPIFSKALECLSEYEKRSDTNNSSSSSSYSVYFQLLKTVAESGQFVIDDSAVLELASNSLIDLCLSRFGDLQNENDRSFWDWLLQQSDDDNDNVVSEVICLIQKDVETQQQLQLTTNHEYLNSSAEKF